MNVSGFLTVGKEGEGLYEEKKSRFLSYVLKVCSEEETEEKLTALRKKHWDARHCCYAYVLGEKSETVKCSDDGEPQKTAGLPILSVLQGAGLTDTMIAVVRYFGGTLLGTGGLVRAYTKAAQLGLEDSTVVRICPVAVLEIKTAYPSLGKLQYFLEQREMKPVSTEFGSDVKLTVLVPLEEEAVFTAKVIDLMAGNVTIEKAGERAEALPI